jgi:transcriptional regulator with XRE-family HTH domain
MTITMPAEMPRKKRIKSDFGKRLVELRKTHGLTQYDLADLIGTTQRTISYYKNEGGRPQALVMAHLARALNVSTDELLGMKKGARTSQSRKTAANHEDPEIRRVWKKFQQLLTLPDKGPTRRHPLGQLPRRRSLQRQRLKGWARGI